MDPDLQQRLVATLKEIAKDAALDAKSMDDQLLSAPLLATHIGGIYAMVLALSMVVEAAITDGANLPDLFHWLDRGDDARGPFQP